jgi:murein L,D-transpeptidase YafK
MLAALMLLVAVSEPPRVQAARAESTAAIHDLFAKAGVAYPPRRMVLRGFKADKQLELWAGGATGALALVRTYPICASSGGPGPKLHGGDGQVPEGFYELSAFNPTSSYLLSMRVSYPNAADKKRSGGKDLGGDIFIHGNCVTIGCIPIQDGPIQELYVIALDARAAGARAQVHLFPGRDWKGLLEKPGDWGPFWQDLKQGYDRFEETHQPLAVSVDARGRYQFMR